MTRPAPDSDLERWRADTPGCARVTHLNNAGAALVPRPVSDAILEHLRLEGELGAYEAAEARQPVLEQAYGDLARLLGTRPANIGFSQNATTAFAQALSALDLGPGDVILTSVADYVSNQIMYLSLARRRGVELVRAPDAPEGGIDPDAVRTMLRKRRPSLVALTWIPTNSGLVQPAEAVGDICRDAEVPYLVDACQAVGQMSIDLSRLDCDYLVAAARKFLRGPRGIGFLYVSDRALAAGAYPLLVDMRGATWTAPDQFQLFPGARRFESWEISYALLLGAGAAVRYALEVGTENVRKRSWALASYARERLAAIPGVRVLDRGPALCAIATVDAGRPAHQLMLTLRARGINTSAADREDAVIDMDAKRTASALRLSPHYYNTREEVDRAVEEISELTSGK